jgi:hypothetical protein
MPTAPRKRSGADEASVPDDPQVTPGFTGGQADHSFTLQAVMELNKTVAVLVERVERIVTSVDLMRDKVSDLSSLPERVGRLETAIQGVREKVESVPVLSERIENINAAAIDAKETTKGLKDKVEALGHWKSWMVGAAAVGTVVCSVGVSVAFALLKPAPQPSPAATPQIVAPAPQPTILVPQPPARIRHSAAAASVP